MCRPAWLIRVWSMPRGAFTSFAAEGCLPEPGR
jgi:hypothetical protein